MVQWGTLWGIRSWYDLQGRRVHSALALKAARPPWDCQGLPVGLLLGMALGIAPLRNSPDGGYSMGQGRGAGLVADQGVTMVWMVH